MVFTVLFAIGHEATAQLDDFYFKNNGKPRRWDIFLGTTTSNWSEQDIPRLTTLCFRVRADQSGKGDRGISYQNLLYQDALSVLTGFLREESSSGADAAPFANFLLGEMNLFWNLNDGDNQSFKLGFNLGDRFFFAGQNDPNWEGLYGFSMSLGPYVQYDRAFSDLIGVRLMAYGSQSMFRDSKYARDDVEKRVLPLIGMIGAEVLLPKGFYVGFERQAIMNKTYEPLARNDLRLGFRF